MDIEERKIELQQHITKNNFHNMMVYLIDEGEDDIVEIQIMFITKQQNMGFPVDNYTIVYPPYISTLVSISCLLEFDIWHDLYFYYGNHWDYYYAKERNPKELYEEVINKIIEYEDRYKFKATELDLKNVTEETELGLYYSFVSY